MYSTSRFSWLDLGATLATSSWSNCAVGLEVIHCMVASLTLPPKPAHFLQPGEATDRIT